MPRGRIGYILAAVGFLVFILSRGIAQLLTDWWWYREIGNALYFVKSIELECLIFAASFTALSLPSFLSIWISRKHAPMRIRVLEGNILEFPEHLIRPYLFPLLYLAAGLISVLASLQAAANWTILLPLFSHPAFHLADPVFGHDVRFYAFYLPILEFAYQIGMTSLIMACILALISYGIQKVLTLGTEGLRMAPVVSIHLSALLALLAAVKGFGYWISIYDLLLTRDGVVFGIGYADFHALLPLLRGIAVVAFVASLMFLINMRLRNWRPVAAICMIWAGFSLALVFYPKIIQQLQVVPSELDKERAYLSNMIAFTRQAYGLENVQATEIHPAITLSPSDVESHEATLDNIRLWDRTPLLQTLAQLQEIRPYYRFVSADVDRYTIGHKLREVMISARELDYGHLQNPTWTNEHLIFTHGYGFVSTPVNKVTGEGLPDFFVRNIPPSGIPEMKVEQPALYYGEAGNEYCIVNTHQQEFDYPSGNENKYTHYQGTGGVTLSSLWRRLVFAYMFSYKIFFSSDIDQTSKILYYRKVRERLQKAFPLLLYDSDPYPVIFQGRIYWMCDAYTVNDHFPYADPVEFHGGVYNYIRNPVKVVMDAYNGDITYYVADPSDPIIQMYSAVFPGFFHPLSRMPKGLASHIRVPEDYFMAQASVYALYHMTDPDVFYNREDLWEFPRSGEDQQIRPYYVIMQLPGNNQPEFLLMLPFTPSKKDNLSAWFAARCDEPFYGSRLVYEFSKEKLIFGPSQIQARINQDPRFSQLRTLWGQLGSQINVGHLQVIPVGNAMLYVEPLYLQSTQRGLPELKLVLLAYGNRIAMEANLQKAFASLFGKRRGGQPAVTQAAAPAAPQILSVQTAVAEAVLHYRKAMEDQRNGDWAGYGKEIKAVGDILETLARENSGGTAASQRSSR